MDGRNQGHSRTSVRCLHRELHTQIRPHHPVEGLSVQQTALAMVFKLAEGAQKRGRRLDSHDQLPKLVLSATFADGIEVIAKPTDRQPANAAA